MLDELQNRAQSAVELAVGAGASDVWVDASQNRSIDFTYRDDQLERVQESTSRSLSLQLYVEGRYSTHSTTDLEPTRLEGFIRDAIAMTRLIEADPFRQITDPAWFEGQSDEDLDLVDRTLDDIAHGTRETWCAEIAEAGGNDDRLISVTSSVSNSHGYAAVASSNGFSGTKEGSFVSMGATVTLRSESDRRPEGSYWIGARHINDLTPAVRVGEEALNNAVRRLGSIAASTRRTTLVVDPKGGGNLLWHLTRPANARHIYQERSFWTELLGQRAFPELFTLTDSPLIPGGHRSRYFDSEGIAAVSRPIIDSGHVANVYVDTYYGRKAEMEPTTGSASNQILVLGAKNLDELCAEVGEGIYVTSWLGGNSDTTTGDFSLGIRGHLIEGGSIGQPIGEMNVSGNILELFQNLVAVGNDPWMYSSTQTPTLVFENVQFSGA